MPFVSTCNKVASSNARHTSSLLTNRAASALTARIGVGPEQPAEDGSLAAIVLRLLYDAGEAIYHDRDAARACIARASALIQAQGDQDAGHGHTPETLVQGGLATWQIIRVKAHIEAHLDSPIRMSDLAAIARLSTSHFSRSFKRSVGVPPFAYVARRRLVRAQDLMLTTDDSLCQIALACGICDQSHLTRLFRRHLGTSPNVWRRRYRVESTTPLAGPLKRAPKPRYAHEGSEASANLQAHSSHPIPTSGQFVATA
jgi:AraC-like DNA-binding protein